MLKNGVETNVFTEEPLEKLVHVADDGIEIQNLGSEYLLPTERKQLAGESGGAIGRFLDFFHFITERIGFLQLVKHQLTVSLDHGEKIIEIMSDTTSQPANGFHLLRLAQLLFKSTPFGDVLRNHFKTFDLSMRVGDGMSTQPHGDGLAVLALPFHLNIFKSGLIAVLTNQPLALGFIGVNISREAERQNFFS